MSRVATAGCECGGGVHIDPSSPEEMGESVHAGDPGFSVRVNREAFERGWRRDLRDKCLKARGLLRHKASGRLSHVPFECGRLDCRRCAGKGLIAGRCARVSEARTAPVVGKLLEAAALAPMCEGQQEQSAEESEGNQQAAPAELRERHYRPLSHPMRCPFSRGLTETGPPLAAPHSCCLYLGLVAHRLLWLWSWGF